MLRAGRKCARGPGARGLGFTLAELMVVVGVVALLVAILLPTFRGAMDAARNSICKSNLYRIAQTLHSDVRSNAAIANGYGWQGVTQAASDNSRDLIWCPSDSRDRSYASASAQMQALVNFYVLQYHTNSTTNPDCSYFPAVFGGTAVPDPQVWAIYPRGGVNQPPKSNWPEARMPHPEENQAFVGIDNDAGCMITFKGTTIKFESWHPPDDPGYSRHYIMEGAGTHPNALPGGTEAGDEDDTKIIRLWGWDYKELAPPYTINIGAQSSYGINGLIEEKNWRPEQFLVMDANELVVEADETNHADFLDEVLVPRHHGKLNVANCDGSVEARTVLDMEMELAEPQGLWRAR